MTVFYLFPRQTYLSSYLPTNYVLCKSDTIIHILRRWLHKGKKIMFGLLKGWKKIEFISFLNFWYSGFTVANTQLGVLIVAFYCICIMYIMVYNNIYNFI